MIIRITVLIFFLLGACRNSHRTSIIGTEEFDTALSVKFARGFEINPHPHFVKLTVLNPWQNATGIEYNYFLSDTVKKSSRLDDFTWIIRTPVRNVVCLSTTHIGLLSFISQTGTVTGVSGKNYVVNALVREKIENGDIADVGYDEGLNYELIVDLYPDVVFAYGVSVSVTNIVRKLNELGIPVVLIGEYLEPDPLGKTEWVKAVAACYEQLTQATEKFDSVVVRYNTLSSLAANTGTRPEILLGLPWQGTWYISGGQSYIARLIHDAGGNYIWRDFDFNESRPMGLEKIYEKALTAEFWINSGEARSLKQIIATDPRFGNLPPMINGNVFNNDNQLTSFGGNDFYETGVTEPDIILSDLISILHPHLLPSHKLKYYRKVN